ncbi:endogenous retrovirus group 3 member 1 Env polyprotein-like [Lissotriton helveticus]
MLLDFEKKEKLCLHREKTSYYNNIFIGSSQCEHNYKVIGGWGFKNGSEPVFPGIYYICGNKAYFKLPDHWYGSCYFGIVFPKIYHVNEVAGSNENTNALVRSKRESVGEIMGDIFSALIPAVGVVLNTHKICQLSTVVDRLSTDTAGGFLMINTEMVAVRSMVLQNRLALDTLLAKEGGVCRMLKAQHCCTYIPDKSVEIKRYVRNITNLEKELKPLEVDSAWKRLTDVIDSLIAVNLMLSELDEI